jgi:hypothetical protein
MQIAAIPHVLDCGFGKYAVAHNLAGRANRMPAERASATTDIDDVRRQIQAHERHWNNREGLIDLP